jgi:hypothetical protein
MDLDAIKTMYEATTGSRNRLFSFVVTPSGDAIEFKRYIGDQKLSTTMIQDAFVVIPGSFNPLHAAHRAFFDNAPKNYGERGARGPGTGFRKVSALFELSINRRDKEPLSLEELIKRLEQFQGYAPVWVTNAMLFFEKTALARGHTPNFEIGYDTAERLVKDHGVLMIDGMDARFSVHSREIGGVLYTLEDIEKTYGDIPTNMRQAYGSLDTAGISSTVIRNGAK